MALSSRRSWNEWTSGNSHSDQDPDHPAFCLSHVLQSPQMWLGIFLGGVLTVIMIMYQVRGAIILGVLFVSICSWPRDSAVTLFPHTPTGDSLFNYFKQVVAFHPLEKVGNAANVSLFIHIIIRLGGC